MATTIDTSAVIAIINGEPSKDRLIELIDSAELIAPASLPWEVGNAFAAMFKRRVATEPDAAAHRLYAYDAYVLACVLQDGGSMLTLDAGLARAARLAGATVTEVTP